MTIALITLAVVLLAREAVHARELDRIRASEAAERHAWTEATQDLLQRIQSPERAVLAHDRAQEGPPVAQYPLSDEETAAAQGIVEAVEALEARYADERSVGAFP